MGDTRARDPQGQYLRWGVLGVARIATEKVIPAMQRAARCEVSAIASRDAGKAQRAAETLGIPKAHGSYEALIADPDIDAIYNPLPNHLHVPWSIRAADAGKHVLCEKPIGMNAREAAELLAVRDRTGVVMEEAFMVHTHPQWTGAIDLIRRGRIGDVHAVAGAFSFFLRDPSNVRAVAEYGGGGLMDLGCYLVHTARWAFGSEPERVMGAIERDPVTGVDRLASLILKFERGHAVGTCSIYQTPYQRVNVLGTSGRIEIEIPFNAPLDRPCRVFISDGHEPTGAATETLIFDTCNQYTVEAERFAAAVLDKTPAPLPLEDSVSNMRVLDAIVRSAASGAWEEIAV
jgi:predicted dehydrogenase